MMIRTMRSGVHFCGYYLRSFLGWRHRPGDWRKLQEERLRIMVREAYENVPLYRRAYDRAGIDPREIRTLDDLARLPLIGKDDLKNGFPQDILSWKADPDKCLVVSTSGSSGAPVRVFRDRRLFGLAPIPFLIGLWATPRFMKRWAGPKLNRRITIIAAADESYDIYLLYRQLRRWPRFLSKNLQYLDTAADPAQLLENLQAHRPDIVAADPMVLRNIAATAKSLGRSLPAIKLIILGGAFLGDNARAELQEAFAGSISEHYGAMEAGTIAFECPDHHGLHPLWPSVILETVRDGVAVEGVAGEIVVTNLWNAVTPVIRYAGLGDAAVIYPGPCPCGSPAPRLKLIDGRQVDSLQLPDGRWIHPFRLTLALEHIPRLDRFQITQETPDRVRVRVIIRKSGAAGEEPIPETVRRNLGAILGKNIRVRVDVVDDIPRLKGSRSNPSPVRSLLASRPRG